MSLFCSFCSTNRPDLKSFFYIRNVLQDPCLSKYLEAVELQVLLLLLKIASAMTLYAFCHILCKEKMDVRLVNIHDLYLLLERLIYEDVSKCSKVVKLEHLELTNPCKDS